jgi:hypothetical protein
MDKEQKNLKVFGYGLAVILGIVAWRLVAKHIPGLWPTILSVTGMFLALMTFLDYQYLRPIYRHWMKIAGIIGIIVTTLILSAVFFLVFGIAGMILRLLRKDLLSQKIEPDKESYWIKRERAGFKRERYTQQF